MPAIDRMLSIEMKIKGALQPNVFPSINPKGIPRTSEPLTPMFTIPMARARYCGSTIFAAMTTHNTISNELLAAEIILEMNKIEYGG